jgi:uncharacterized protein
LHARITLEETPLFADPSGALYWPQRRTLAVADADFAPRATLLKLQLLVRRYAPARVVCLGPARALQALAPPDWIFLAGDDAIVEDKLVLRHKPAAGDALGIGEIVGSFRPRAAIETKHGRIEGACFALDGRRMAMPAFGGEAASASRANDVRSQAFVRLFGRARTRVLLLGKERLQMFSRDRLVPLAVPNAYRDTTPNRAI